MNLLNGRKCTVLDGIRNPYLDFIGPIVLVDDRVFGLNHTGLGFLQLENLLSAPHCQSVA